MGSTSPPPTSQTNPAPSPSTSLQSADKKAIATTISKTTYNVNPNQPAVDWTEPNVPELKRLLEQQEQEIQMLKFELEKYKLALHQSQLEYHYIQQQQQLNAASNSTKEPPIANSKDKINTSATDNNRQTRGGTLLPIDKRPLDVEQPLPEAIRAPAQGGSQVKDANIQSDIINESKRVTSLKPSFASGGRVVFKTGDDDDDHHSEGEKNQDDIYDQNEASSEPNVINELEEVDPDMENIIHDVSEIDLDTELEVSVKDSKKEKRRKRERKKNSRLSSDDALLDDVEQDLTKHNENEDESADEAEEEEEEEEEEEGEEDEDIISDGLLTSLTDAAISNLSQLAALQERCESQQHSHQYQQQQQQQQTSPTSSDQTSSIRHRQNSAGVATSGPSSSSALSGSFGHHQQHPLAVVTNSQILGSDFSQTVAHAFSTSTIANQAALAISAAAVASNSANVPQQLAQSTKPVSVASSISPSSTIQADLSSSNSLASVVAAAAVAAAAAAANDNNNNNSSNNPQQPQHHSSPLNHPHGGLTGSASRLSSALSPSPEFYHSLQQQHHHHQTHHAQQAHHQHQHSPASSLHFSPSASVTPSPSSLIMSSQTRRSPSNTSSSLMSPIASPNYLRRQFMPDRIPLLSPSPTSGLGTSSLSGLTTASSSGASSSLAHILHHHHQASVVAAAHHHHQQRSASALAGSATTLTSPSSASITPLSGSGSTAVSPLMSNKNSSQARLNNMQIRHKFGYLGSGRAQFNSPHGFCLGLNQEIVVADTNNHRVCIFDKSGTYITQFGSPGKEEGQLWNPRKVAILHRPASGTSFDSGSSASASSSSLHQLHSSAHHHPQLTSPFSSSHQLSQLSNTISNSNNSNSSHLQSNITTNTNEPLYVVCDRGAERSRMQLFTKDGAFIKKIGIHYIDIVAGLAITQNGLIIVVDSVSPTVYIINGETGILNGWFDCSGYMKEPSDIAVKSDVPGNEYFICDFKGHCVVVFSEQGEYLRKIGHDGLTSYPNGIDISDDGDILVGDSHGNRFHVVVFDRNGNFVSQFECPHVKVSRCCGLKITREGYIVTLAKNNHHVLVLDTIHI